MTVNSDTSDYPETVLDFLASMSNDELATTVHYLGGVIASRMEQNGISLFPATSHALHPDSNLERLRLAVLSFAHRIEVNALPHLRDAAVKRSSVQ